MSEKDPRDRDGLFGYTPGYGKSPEVKLHEVQVSTQQLLASYLPQLSNQLEFRSQESQAIIDIDSSSFARELKSEFQELIEKQEFLAMCVIGLGTIAQKALTQVELQTNELGELSEQGQIAFDQRNQALSALNDGFTRVTAALQSIENTIGYKSDQLVDAIDWLGFEVKDLKSIVQEIGETIVGKLQDIEDLAIWMHIQNQSQRNKSMQEAQIIADRKLIIQARLLMMDGSYDKAYKILQIAQDTNPHNPDTWFSLAYCLVYLGKHDEALKYVYAIIGYAKLGKRLELQQRLLDDEIFNPLKDKINNQINNE